MDLALDGKRALVLGGSQGLGKACAASLAGEGAQVIINGRTEQTAEATARELGARAFVGDISQPDERRRIVDQANQMLGGIDILVTNAGGPPPGPLVGHDHETWLAALEANMLSAIDLCSRVVPAMVDQRFGRVVNVTSFTVREPYPNMGLATAVRTGLTGAMASLAREVASSGVTINNLLPGLMDTGALKRVYAAQARNQNITEDEAKANMANSVPAGRLGEAEDFGPMCAFLCSRHASYITGQNITVDGGLARCLL